MRNRSGLFSPVVVAFVLATGFLAVSAVLVAWAHETVRSLRPVLVEERVVFLADGRAVVERLVQGHPPIPPEEKFLDLEGNRVSVPEDARWAQGVPLYRGQRGEGLLGGWLSPQESWDWRLQRLSDPRDPVAWYFLCDGRRHGWGYFVAYNTARAEAVGYLGTAGFRTDRLPPEERFPFNGSDRGIVLRLLKPNTHYWRFHPIDPGAPQPRPAAPALYLQADNDTVYQVDLAARQVRVAFEGGPIWAAGLLTRPASRPGVGRSSLVVRTDDAVVEFDGQNKVVRRFPIPDDLRQLGFLWLETASGEAVTLTDLEYDLAAARVRDQISWYDGSGRLLRREEIWTKKSPHKDERVLAAGTLSPLLGYWIFVDPPVLRYFDRWGDFRKALVNRLTAFWPALVLVHVVAGGLAWLSYRRLVRYGAGRAERIVWPAFVFLFGLPGWVGFRLARSWPVLEPCPSCRAVVPRDRVPCAGCGADFPLPALQGTEVFA